MMQEHYNGPNPKSVKLEQKTLQSCDLPWAAFRSAKSLTLSGIKSETATKRSKDLKSQGTGWLGAKLTCSKLDLGT